MSTVKQLAGYLGQLTEPRQGRDTAADRVLRQQTPSDQHPCNPPREQTHNQGCSCTPCCGFLDAGCCTPFMQGAACSAGHVGFAKRQHAKRTEAFAQCWAGAVSATATKHLNKPMQAQIMSILLARCWPAHLVGCAQTQLSKPTRCEQIISRAFGRLPLTTQHNTPGGPTHAGQTGADADAGGSSMALINHPEVFFGMQTHNTNHEAH